MYNTRMFPTNTTQVGIDKDATTARLLVVDDFHMRLRRVFNRILIGDQRTHHGITLLRELIEETKCLGALLFLPKRRITHVPFG